MATKLRGHKSEHVAVRLTSRQYDKLNTLAIARDATISDVLRDIVDNLRVDFALPYQNSETSGMSLPASTGFSR